MTIIKTMTKRAKPTEYVTKSEFKSAMLNIDNKFTSMEDRIDKIDAKFDTFRDEFFAYVREIMDEQRAHYEETHKREIGALQEHIDHKFVVLMEHPVFTDYQKSAEARMGV